MTIPFPAPPAQACPIAGCGLPLNWGRPAITGLTAACAAGHVFLTNVPA